MDMKPIVEITTDRLLLRAWTALDLIHFAKMNANPLVMKYYPRVMTTDESDVLANKIIDKMLVNGWGFWAVELREDNTFIGFVGLNEPHYELPVKPCVEIGWRLSNDHWGKGYATEAATASMDFAFKTLKLDQIYSFTSLPNTPSRAVMERLGMTNMKSNFNHPMIPKTHKLSEHFLFKIDKDVWFSKNDAFKEEAINHEEFS